MAKDIPQHNTARRVSATVHMKRTAQRHRAKRTAPSSRGYDKRWEKFRKSFLAANPLCEYCLARGRVQPATVCDHDIPHRDDPDLFYNNTFTALCKWDHDSTKQRMEARYSGDELLKRIAMAKGLT